MGARKLWHFSWYQEPLPTGKQNKWTSGAQHCSTLWEERVLEASWELLRRQEFSKCSLLSCVVLFLLVLIHVKKGKGANLNHEISSPLWNVLINKMGAEVCTWSFRNNLYGRHKKEGEKPLGRACVNPLLLHLTDPKFKWHFKWHAIFIQSDSFGVTVKLLHGRQPLLGSPPAPAWVLLLFFTLE